MPTPYDAIIVGTGQAAPYLAGRLTRAGMRIAVVERHLFGGTCVNTGCIPTKTMVASAYAAHMARRAGEFGVVTGDVRVNMHRVQARKDEISGKSRTGVESALQKMDGCTIYRDHARFVGPHELSVGNERITAERIFLNVGARAATPPLAGLGTVPFLNNASILELDTVPKHLVIVGGSYIGLEFGQMFRRFGSDVTIIEMGPRLIAREDEDISLAIQDILEREGIEIRLNATCIALSKAGDDVVARVDCRNGVPEVRGSHLLLAVGRRPNTDDLGLDAAGIAVDDKGYIVVDDQLRTSVPGVWAVGDCNGKGGFTHTSYNDGEIVAANLLDKDPRRVSDRIPTYALFIDPPLGRAGMTEADVLTAGRRALIATRPMSRVGRANEKGEPLGCMKILVDADTKKILGAAILGTGGDEIIHAILDVMYADAPYTTISRAMHIHPTVSEYLPTILSDLHPFS